MAKLFLVLSIAEWAGANVLRGFPLTAGEGFSEVYTSRGDVRASADSFSLHIGPDTAAVESLQSGLLSDLEVALAKYVELGVRFTLEIEDLLGQMVLSVAVVPPDVVVATWAANRTCALERIDAVETIRVHFGLVAATVEYEGIKGRKECTSLPLSPFGEAYRYRLSAASARPKTVTVKAIRWAAASDPLGALESLQFEVESQLASLQGALRSTLNQSVVDEFISGIAHLNGEIEAMEQRLVGLSTRWESLQTTEYMTRPEHLIHHFRNVLRDLEREVGHLYDRITHGALSEYAEHFIHERKEVMPMEVLLGAYAWQVEKKLGNLRTHIDTLERFTWIFALAAVTVVAGLVTAVVVRKAEKLHKL